MQRKNLGALTRRRRLSPKQNTSKSLVLAVTHRLEGPEVQIQTALAEDVLRYWGTIKIG